MAMDRKTITVTRHNSSITVSRRGFLRSATAAAAGVGFPMIVPRRAVAGADETPPSERIGVAHIGVGNQGGNNLASVFRLAKRADTVAVCDVDRDRLTATQKKAVQKTGRNCQAYDDYRRVLDDADVDAVVVTVPDHWHALMTVEACQAGKDVYCEKPLSLTVADGRAMVAAARRHERIVQTGSMQRSDDRFRRACELVRSGAIGKVHTVRCGISGVNFKGEAAVDGDPPPELNYDAWLGPAPWRPYNVRRVHYNFRFFWDYSGGQMTNWGAHSIDIAHWGLGCDAAGLLAVEGTARYAADGLYEVPAHFQAVYNYPGDVTLIASMDVGGGATVFEGAAGKLTVSRKELKTDPADLAQQSLPAAVELYRSGDHFTDWLDCIASRRLPICDVEIGHRTATACHLGNIAIRLGRKIRWDAATETVIDDAEANGWLSRPYRSPWALPTG